MLQSSKRLLHARALAPCLAASLFGALIACSSANGTDPGQQGAPGDTSSGGTPGGGTSGGGTSSGGTSSGGTSSGGTSSGGVQKPDSGTSSGGGTPDSGTTGDDGGGGGGQDSGGSSGGGPLDPKSAPGGNFDLTVWELQEPVGSPGSPTTISPAQLKGPTGFQDAYFFTDPADGSMSFWDPESGVTTPNSSYPRSELREMTAAGAPADWAVAGTHTLSATLKATQIPDHVAVGQIHLGTGTPASTKPLLELFYFATGEIDMAIEQTPAGGNEVRTTVGTVPVGTQWSYIIGLSGSTISFTLNGGAAQTFQMSSTFNQENMYFKAGDYDQSVGSSTTVGAKVQFYALKVFHGP